MKTEDWKEKLLERDFEERYRELNSPYQDAVRECYDEVFSALKQTEKPQPNAEDLYSELENPNRARAFFGKASVALANIGILELWDEEVRNSNYRFQMSEMDTEYLEEAEQEVEKLL
ncbi:MAG: hypothetical protein ACI8Z7_000392 [Candidatus Nanohaloarchaea archaeon]|jgi:hypothetical protein